MNRPTRIALSVLLLAGLFLLVLTGATGSEATTDRGPTVRVTGRAQALVAPDQARMTVVVATEGATSAVGEENARKTVAVVDALQQEGIRDDDLETGEVSIMPVTVWDPQTGETRVTGYRAQHRLQVTVRDVTSAGPVMDAAIRAGAESVSQMQFFLSDDTKDAQTARLIERAVQDGAAKARAAAGAAGVRVDGVQEIVVLETGGQMVRMEDAVLEAEGKGGVSTVVFAGEIRLEASVELTYRLTGR